MSKDKNLFGTQRFHIINYQGIKAIFHHQLLINKEWILFTFIFYIGLALLFVILIKITISANDLMLFEDELFSPLDKIMPGLVLFAAILNCFSSNAVGILEPKLSRSFEDMLIAPITSIEVISAKLGFYLLLSSSVSFITYLVLLPFGIKILPESLLPIIISLFLSIIFFSLLGMYCGLKAKKWDQLSIIETALFPIIFFSGTVVPNSEFPSFISRINQNNPLTNLFGTFRSSWFGLPFHFNLGLLTVIILVSSVCLFMLIARELNKRLSLT